MRRYRQGHSASHQQRLWFSCNHGSVQGLQLSVFQSRFSFSPILKLSLQLIEDDRLSDWQRPLGPNKSCQEMTAWTLPALLREAKVPLVNAYLPALPHAYQSLLSQCDSKVNKRISRKHETAAHALRKLAGITQTNSMSSRGGSRWIPVKQECINVFISNWHPSWNVEERRKEMKAGIYEQKRTRKRRKPRGVCRHENWLLRKTSPWHRSGELNARQPCKFCAKPG